MAKYRVQLVQTVLEEATVYVEAESIEEAEQKALERVGDLSWQAGDLDWSFLESTDSDTIVSVNVVEEKAHAT